MRDPVTCEHPRRGPSLRGALLTVLITVSAAALGQQQPSLVRVDTVRSETVTQTVPVLGRLVPRQAGTVAAQVHGPVAGFGADVGDRVARGEIIARLDPDMLTVARDIAAGRLGEAEARLQTRRARLALARQERERLERLKQTQATSRALYDDARQQEVIAETEVVEATAALAGARAELRLAEINLARTEIRAPYDGVITQRLTETGAYVQAGQAVARMLGDRDLEIEADVPFDRLGGLGPETEVTVTLDDGSTHPAAVRAVVPEENALTRTRAVRFVPRFGDVDGRLAAEQSVTVHVPASAARSVVSVHKDAVTRQGDRAVVYRVNDDTAEQRTVRLGAAIGNRFEVLDGLSPGDIVVVRGNERLRPNDKVRVERSTS
ncbi:MAG: efflux RND transporter periplasmic adaptor subunit [Ectothiorhodospiraceae bacterium]|nr:efflux RND transporter periplasmic adaptor subunit [Chromatiales bacterium]MCP5154624.1 efflux RND transporter periplasmic adaptor subunit [Ectothiorhodospiraceae bacterium]